MATGCVSDIDRFFRHVDPSSGPTACWPWIGARRENGYGMFKAEGRMRIAHRWLLGALRGAPLMWPKELGCHHCDNPPCCNPVHLYVGSHASNVHDALVRGRMRVPVAELNASKSSCKRGHPFDNENTIRRSTGKRGCRTCERSPRCMRGHEFSLQNTAYRGAGRRRICLTCELARAA